MFFKEKILEKFLAIFLAFLLVFNPMIAPFVWAEGEEPPVEEPVVEVEVIDEEPEGEGDSTIATGDAESQAEVETTANTNIDCLPGEVTTPSDPCASPEVTTECEEDVIIANDNLADVADTATSSATTGDNLIEGAAGDALIDTGDAIAGATLNNEINTNVVEFIDGEEEITPSAEASPSAEATPSAEITTETPSCTLQIENENEGSLTNDADVLADTGGNQANENGGQATIETGDALAYANLLNFLNTNIVGSDFKIYLLDLLEGYEGEINLHQVSLEMFESEEFGFILNEEGNLFLVQNSNSADLENEVNVTAASGGNEANENGGDVSLETGQATALANVVNFVNINLVGSQFFLGIINIFDSFLGDLILPRPEKFMVENGTDTEGSPTFFVFENENLAEVEGSVAAVADTGNNETNNNGGNSLIQTGNAESQANSFSLVNTNIQRNNWFFLSINNLGSWLGKIFGWSSPEAIEELNGDQPIILQTNAESQPAQPDQLTPEGSQEITGIESEPASIVQNQNQATIENNISVTASTGNNSASGNGGDTEIITGQARSLANLFNLVNLNIFGSRWFLGLINILGDWRGNIIFAYPDVTTTLTNGSGQAMVGETTEYNLSYQNQGYDQANNVSLQFELPQGLFYLGDSSGFTPQVSGNTYSWQIGTLNPGEEGSFIIEVQIDPQFSFEEPLSFWSKIIPQVQAAENGQESEVVATASIGTSDPESDLFNNRSSVTTIVYSPLLSEEVAENNEDVVEGVNQGQPKLEITAWNNVNEFIYPGDTVTFEITIKNTGETTSYDTYLTQELFDGGPEGFGTASFEIGDLEPGQGGKLSFGLQLADNGLLPRGDYYTVAQAYGFAPNGNEVASNEAKTTFEIRSKEALFSPVQAVLKEEEEGEVLASEDAYPGLPYDCEKDWMPYFLLSLLSLLWLIQKGRERWTVNQLNDEK